jgi:hypothetical protein
MTFGAPPDRSAGFILSQSGATTSSVDLVAYRFMRLGRFARFPRRCGLVGPVSMAGPIFIGSRRRRGVRAKARPVVSGSVGVNFGRHALALMFGVKRRGAFCTPPDWASAGKVPICAELGAERETTVDQTLIRGLVTAFRVFVSGLSSV